MAEALEKIRAQLNEFFLQYNKRQKITMAVALALVLLIATGVIFYVTRTEYVVLYDNLDPQQSGEVMNVLQANNIRAQLGATSRIIEVPKSDEKRAQVVVATEGLPTARFSFDEAFSGSSFMMTSEERSRRIQLAQQNFLAATIEEIPGVRKAVVNISIPERSGFLLGDEQSFSKASVFLDLQNQLDDASVNGIAVLVSNAVDGLVPENVTVHGPDGRVLSQRQESSEAMEVSNQLTMQRTVKSDLEKSITDFLSTVYGYGNVVVMANVRLDFNSEVTEIQQFSPPIEDETEGIARSLQELHRSSVSEGGGAVPGTDPNVEDVVQYVEMDGTTTTYEEASRTINYEINELRQKIIKAQGQVQDITVAVFINSDALPDGNLTDDERTELMNIISAAAGLDTRVVQVGVQRFDVPAVPDFTTAAAPVIPVWLLVVLAVVALVGSFLLYRRFTRKEPEDELELDMAFQDQVPEDDLELEMSGSQVKQQIEKLVDKNPEAISHLLRNWLSED
ncbi:flagellar basal-body MS-ring/collar protein FliF [Anoxynatronum buryatiense]|uniref:Flagellar M-ring protein n=1 Tax=Anoxynatronum buryatiense TaxID=489973 RepID=A0AA45WUN5_9CLOT|nr:flagellar basal-body MS-ring/collar protein FliF [Anoxynatronum buryatiense]SMP47180.1 flagellar M-ring protein FliF [Anoxynatronum buryatiense]